MALARRISPQALLEKAHDRAHQTQPVAIKQIDFSRPFLPEHMTQLYYTPVYQTLNDVQRLRYNQLFGVRTNEYIMLFESDFLDHFLTPLRRHSKVVAQEDLLRCLDTMIDEERRHYAVFVRLNRMCLPSVFAGGRERYFSELPRGAEALFSIFGALARSLSFPLYYAMAMEESAIALGRALSKGGKTETLGELEPHFVDVHREHMKDEARHVHIDWHLIDACLSGKDKMSRALNARLFRGLAKALSRIGRHGSGARVIRHFVRERPELAPREAEMIEAIIALNHHPDYQRSLFNRELMPLVFGLFDQRSEFDDLPRHMVGYGRP